MPVSSQILRSNTVIWPNSKTYKWPTSCAATMIPEKPPVSSMMATELTFSNRLFTTHAPPTYAKPDIKRVLKSARMTSY